MSIAKEEDLTRTAATEANQIGGILLHVRPLQVEVEGVLHVPQGLLLLDPLQVHLHTPHITL
jgi:hypothetical protein